MKERVKPQKPRHKEKAKAMINKWIAYKIDIQKNVSIILKEQHFVNIYQDKIDIQTSIIAKDERLVNVYQENFILYMNEIYLSKAKIVQAKTNIYSVFQQIAGENRSDKKWQCLTEENDEIDIDGVLCSRCNEDAVDGNDIILCDKAGCFRAYHEKCLEPQNKVNLSDDWFCRQCACIDECLDLVNEIICQQRADGDKCACEHWQELFPEIRDAKNTRLVMFSTILS
jgi:hypothetical protein